jgi:NADH:ubiquinone oxidoreductase subunit E
MSAAQEIFGYLPQEAMMRIAAGLGVPAVDIYGIASFYSYFITMPPARHSITSCQGTACYVRGGERVLEELERTLEIKTGETTEDGEFSIQAVRCMGACALAPVVRIDSDIYSRVSQRRVKGLLSRYSKEDSGDR